MRKQKHNAMVMLLFLRKAHSRRIPQKQVKNKKKKNVLNKSDSFYESTASNAVDCY
jgi:hypothetical protein